ncbi:hypothetical protein BRPE64_ACDS08180 [Caballeronia insecticola]|uniref:Uncharacterized protein n=1 Tax=Caballeronia insecticola TaxID=758793 RepID=R4WX83_9BURK|nr:hypothetical protein BRPE64_ACDS08180 [Caballeronia insecticola]
MVRCERTQPKVVFRGRTRAGCGASCDSHVVGANLTPTRRSVSFLSFFWTFEVKLLFAYFVLVLSLPI